MHRTLSLGRTPKLRFTDQALVRAAGGIMFEWINNAVSSVTLAYLVRNFPGLLLLFAGAVLAIVIAWKHGQKSSTWKWNPRQVFDAGLGLIAFYLLGMGTWLTFWWTP